MEKTFLQQQTCKVCQCCLLILIMKLFCEQKGQISSVALKLSCFLLPLSHSDSDDQCVDAIHHFTFTASPPLYTVYHKYFYIWFLHLTTERHVKKKCTQCHCFSTFGSRADLGSPQIQMWSPEMSFFFNYPVKWFVVVVYEFFDYWLNVVSRFHEVILFLLCMISLQTLCEERFTWTSFLPYFAMTWVDIVCLICGLFCCFTSATAHCTFFLCSEAWRERECAAVKLSREMALWCFL